MITHIRMKNFKSWKDSGEVKLAPLTGFFGTNSSGKSSLLQMLLLLKQTAEREDSEEVIFFGDEDSCVNLGSFPELIHGHQVSEILELEFGCKFNEPLQIRVPSSEYRPVLSHRPTDVEGITFETCIRKPQERPVVDKFSYHRLPDNVEILKWQQGKFNYGRSSDDIRIIRSCYKLTPSNQFRYTEDIVKLIKSFEDQFLNVHYLGPIRAKPQRQYHWSEKLLANVGHLGQKMIDAMLVSRANQQKTPHYGEEVLIEDRISKWLQKMDLAYAFSIEPANSRHNLDYNVYIQKSSDSAKVTLADIGYGLSQFLPVLINCYFAREGSTLILEQPSMHLHPMVQSQLADLLIEVVNERKLQILIESHSEHLLTRLQLRIAEQKIAADQTALYFCENENGASKIKSLELDDLGNIKNWPKNFFGNVRGDLLKMTREQMKRQKEAEG